MVVNRTVLAAIGMAGVLVFGSGTGTALAVSADSAGMAGPAPQQSILVSYFDDGSFEYPTVPANSYATFSAGQSIGPWLVTSGGVDLIHSGFWQAAEGNQSVDLNALQPGTVAQTFTTTPGTTYTVTYAVAGNVDSGPTVKTGQVLVDGQVFQDFAFDITGKTKTNMGYVKRQVTFVASGTTTTLAFASTTQAPRARCSTT